MQRRTSYEPRLVRGVNPATHSFRFGHSAIEDEEMEEGLIEPAYQHVCVETAVRQHEVYLSGAIREPFEYVPLLSALRNASENDVFHFYLNSPGGYVAAGLQLINAVQESAAHVVMQLDPLAHSMAAILFIQGDELIVPDSAELMFHMYAGGLMGKGNEQLAAVHAAAQSYDRLLRTCSPFLTEKEVKAVLNGKDLWLDATNIRTRLERMAEAQSKARLEAQHVG